VDDSITLDNLSDST